MRHSTQVNQMKTKVNFPVRSNHLSHSNPVNRMVAITGLVWLSIGSVFFGQIAHAHTNIHTESALDTKLEVRMATVERLPTNDPNYQTEMEAFALQAARQAKKQRMEDLKNPNHPSRNHQDQEKAAPRTVISLRFEREGSETIEWEDLKPRRSQTSLTWSRANSAREGQETFKLYVLPEDRQNLERILSAAVEISGRTPLLIVNEGGSMSEDRLGDSRTTYNATPAHVELELAGTKHNLATLLARLKDHDQADVARLLASE